MLNSSLPTSWRLHCTGRLVMNFAKSSSAECRSMLNECGDDRVWHLTPLERAYNEIVIVNVTFVRFTLRGCAWDAQPGRPWNNLATARSKSACVCVSVGKLVTSNQVKSSHVCAVSTQQQSTFQSTKLKSNSTGWAKDGQSSHLIKPSLHLMTAKFNSTGEAQNMSSKRYKNKTQKPKMCSI